MSSLNYSEQDEEMDTSGSEGMNTSESGKMDTSEPGKIPKKISVMDLLNLSEKTRCIIPALIKNEEINEQIKKIHPDLEVRTFIPERQLKRRHRNAKRKRSDDDDDEENFPPGEYEVEEIVDAGIEDDGTLKYKVKWKGWDESENSWEPIENLANSIRLIDEYHQKLSKMEEEEAHKQLINLILKLKRVINPSGPDDEGLLLKLCNKPVSFTNEKNWTKVLQESLRQKCSRALDFLTHGSGDLTCEALLSLTCKQLKVEENFGSFAEMCTWIEKRESSVAANKRREAEINAKIDELKDGPHVIVENLVDDDVLVDFEYVKEYKPMNGMVIQKEAIVRCTCTDCYETKRKGGLCCWHECNKKPYNKDGTLLLDVREAIYECNDTCACPPDCPMKVVSKGVKYSFKVFRSDNNRGWGLKANERIPKGKFIITYAGELITIDEADARAMLQKSSGQTYLYDLDYQTEALFTIDAKDVANLARFINHSCEPNLSVHPVWIHNLDINIPIIAFFTTRVVAKGEELVFDYNVKKTEEYQMRNQDEEEEENSETAQPMYKCNCDTPSCKGFYF